MAQEEKGEGEDGGIGKAASELEAQIYSVEQNIEIGLTRARWKNTPRLREDIFPDTLCMLAVRRLMEYQETRSRNPTLI